MNLIMIIFCMILCISCSQNKEENFKVSHEDGTKIIVNKKIPLSKNKISLQKKLTISGKEQTDSMANFYRPTGMDINENSEIFILDYSSFSIKKFNKNGQFETSFGRKGNGPGEFQNPMTLCCSKDKVYLSDAALRKILVFDNRGKFLFDIKLDNNMPDIFVLKDSLFAGIAVNFTPEENKMFFFLNLNLYDLDFKIKKNISTQKIAYDINNMINPFMEFPLFCLNNDHIFIAPKNVDKYQISKNLLQNFSRQLLINRDYRKIPYTEKEIQKLKIWTNRMFGGDKPINKMKFKNKRSIRAIFIDKNQNLWVIAQAQDNNENIIFDIYNQEGVLKIREKIDFPLDYYEQLNSSIKFRANKIYLLNKTETFVNIYEYNY